MAIVGLILLLIGCVFLAMPVVWTIATRLGSGLPSVDALITWGTIAFGGFLLRSFARHPRRESTGPHAGWISLLLGIAAWMVTFVGWPLLALTVDAPVQGIGFHHLCLIVGVIAALVAYRSAQGAATAKAGLVLSSAYFIILMIFILAAPFLLPLVQAVRR